MAALKGIMKRPGGLDEGKEGKAETGYPEKHKKHNYLPLLAGNNNPAEQNLLIQSLSAKLTKTFQKEGLKRHSISEMGHKNPPLSQTRTKGLNQNVFEKIRRHQQAKKHEAWCRRKQEKLHARLKSWAADAERYLPQNKDGIPGRDVDSLSSGSREKIRFDDYPRAHRSSVMSFSTGCGDDSVRVVKKDGVFRPLNKYGKSRHVRGADDIPFSNTLVEYETVSLPVKFQQNQTKDTSNGRSKKGLSVSWSAQSYHSNTEEKQSEGDRDSKSGSARSFTSEPIGWRPPTFSSGKSEVQKVGIKWKLPLPKRAPPLYASHPGRMGRPQNLTPVTSGMDKAGTSMEKTRWRVMPSSQESSYGVDIRSSLRAIRHMNIQTESTGLALSNNGTADSVCCQTCWV